MTEMGGKRSFASKLANDRPWDLTVIPDGDCERQRSAGADLLEFAGAATPMSISDHLPTDQSWAATIGSVPFSESLELRLIVAAPDDIVAVSIRTSVPQKLTCPCWQNAIARGPRWAQFVSREKPTLGR
jgi:hypothetical protein